MKVMKRIFVLLLITGGIFAAPLMRPDRVSAVSPAEYLPISCDRTKGNYKPMTTLVLIPLGDRLAVRVGESAQDVAKSLFFDFAYVRGNNVAPIHAISHNGEIAYLSCDYPDYSANIVSATDTGYFMLGVFGAIPVDKIQSIIDTLKLTKFQQAELVTTADEKNTTIALANTKPCGDLCMGLKPSKDGVEKRDFKLKIVETTSSKSVRQKELVSFSVKVKNEGIFPIYAEGVNSLYLAPTTKKLSQLYHSSWQAPTLIAKIPGLILPGEESAISATLGAPLLPGKYTESLQLKMGNIRIGDLLPVSFTVENDNYALAKIVSKDGSQYANLRDAPSLGSKVLSRIDVGTYVILKGSQDAWIKIETKEGRVGWVYKPFIREL
jgi:hypothetical protein